IVEPKGKEDQQAVATSCPHASTDGPHLRACRKQHKPALSHVIIASVCVSLHLISYHLALLFFRRVNSSKASRDSETMATKEDVQDPRIPKIASSIRVIPDFPKPGIMFQDITTLLLDTEAFKDTIDIFVERYKGKGISVVAGVEARGFIFGPPIALAIGAKFVPLRKPKKLPGKVISEEYSLEYGTDKIEMHVGAVEPGERAIIIDDLIATGGTLAAAIRLLERVGVTIAECACVIELPVLKGREKLGETPLFILVTSDAA
ncbi:hypothetical protein DY000_02047138, partial [Brassica cretica]